MAIRILLQTTLPPTAIDDWTISRFSLLLAYLASLQDEAGKALCHVTARDREPDSAGNDPVLSQLDRQDFDELWLFALDVGDGLSPEDVAGISRFHQQGGGVLTTRDHQDMGISMCGLTTLGGFHYFHSQQTDPDPDRCCRDDVATASISWPNYHSGANGDLQTITPLEPLHPLLQRPGQPSQPLQMFPAHPHEGAVGVPNDHPHARVVATGTSRVTGRSFNLIVAADRVQDEAGNQWGRVIAQSTFHHFCDYNWDVTQNCPSFVDEPPGTMLKENPAGLADVHTYVKNAALWLVPTPHK